jgi:ComF family protein
VLKELVHRHKFGHDLGLGLLLGALVRQVWEMRSLPRPDYIVPVPMFPNRVLRRGFNQSAELARMLGKVLDQKPLMGGLRKIRDTQVQSSLGRVARRRNVTGVFEASRLVSGTRVLLVDDVMTTGATLTACARACLDAGAVGIDVFVLARAL